MFLLVLLVAVCHPRSARALQLASPQETPSVSSDALRSHESPRIQGTEEVDLERRETEGEDKRPGRRHHHVLKAAFRHASLQNELGAEEFEEDLSEGEDLFEEGEKSFSQGEDLHQEESQLSTDEDLHLSGRTVEIQDSAYEGMLVDLTIDEHRRWRDQVPSRSSDCPPVFIAIMSKRESAEKRSGLRELWSTAGEGWGAVASGFAICATGDPDEPPEIEEHLWAEQDRHGDLNLMNCTEGYKDGLLTLKVIAAMRIYLEQTDHELFMKIDDDSFVSPSRMCDVLSPHFTAHPADDKYIGVFAEKGEIFGRSNIPCRDETSDWYEPESKFGGTRYPPAAKGGPGYMLTRRLVTDIIGTGVADSFVLNNEDKAVAVWVRQLLSEDRPIRLVNLPGTDGYLRYHPSIKLVGKWERYPYVVHHHLLAKEIACLHNVEQAGDEQMYIDDCFDKEYADKVRQKEEDSRRIMLLGEQPEGRLLENNAACSAPFHFSQGPL